VQLEYRVYVFGLPIGLNATVNVSFEQHQVKIKSRLKNWVLSNTHSTTFTLSDCQYQPQGYRNYGFSPGWRFDDTLNYDWNAGVARYYGKLQRPGQSEGVYQELQHVLDQSASKGDYVDKLSQFFVMGCHFGGADDERPLLLNYLDDTLGRYRVNIVQRGERLTVNGQEYQTIEVESEPYEATPGSIHRRVRYWLVPELEYLPVMIKTTLGSLPLKVRLSQLKSPD